MARRKQQQKYSDRELLELFVEHVDKLKGNSLIREGRLKRVSFMSMYEEGKDSWYELRDVNGDLIDMERFEALIVSFRLFYMEGGDTNIRKICDVAYQYITRERREAVANFRQSWNVALKEDTHLRSASGGFESIDTVLRNYLNGEIFHSDKEKRDFVKRWGEPLVGETVFIINFLRPLIIWFGDFVSEGLQNDWFDFSDR